MSLRIRRGTNAQRTGITFDLGEIVYTTDTQKLYIGDGVTAGGKNLLETSSGNGFTFNQATQQIDFSIGNLNLNTSQVTEDASRLYYTDERAQDAVAAALVAGNAYNAGITFTYNDALNRITAVSTGGLVAISSDTNPSLGGNLSIGSYSISGNGAISGSALTATGAVTGGSLSVSGSATTNILNVGTSIRSFGTLQVDGASTMGYLSVNNNTVTSSTSSISLGSTANPLAVNHYGQVKNMIGVTASGAVNSQNFNLRLSRGTLAAPTTVLAQDLLGGYTTEAWDGAQYSQKTNIVGRIDTVTGTNTLPGSFGFIVHDYNGNYTNALAISSRGVVVAQFFRASAFATTTARDTQIGTPLAGTICFVTNDGSGNKKFMGYDGTAWVNLN